MSKNFDSAKVRMAGGIVGEITVSRKGNIYFTAPSFTDFDAKVLTGKASTSRVSIRPAGTGGQGKLLDTAIVATPDDKVAIVRSRESGLVSIEIEGSWGMTWNTVVKGSGWHVAMRQFS